MEIMKCFVQSFVVCVTVLAVAAVAHGAGIGMRQAPLYVLDGEDATITCAAQPTQGSGKVRYTWLHGRVKQPADDPQLSISAATAQDTGNYMCKVKGSRSPPSLHRVTVWKQPLLWHIDLAAFKLLKDRSCKDHDARQLVSALHAAVCPDKTHCSLKVESGCLNEGSSIVIYVTETFPPLPELPSPDCGPRCYIEKRTQKQGEAYCKAYKAVKRLDTDMSSGRSALGKHYRPVKRLTSCKKWTGLKKQMSCEAGYFLRVTRCTPCPPGTSSPGSKKARPGKKRARQVCTSCPLGTYQPRYAQGGCVACPPGHNTGRTGARSMQQCVAAATVVPKVASKPTPAVTPGFARLANVIKAIDIDKASIKNGTNSTSNIVTGNATLESKMKDIGNKSKFVLVVALMLPLTCVVATLLVLYVITCSNSEKPGDLAQRSPDALRESLSSSSKHSLSRRFSGPQSVYEAQSDGKHSRSAKDSVMSGLESSFTDESADESMIVPEAAKVAKSAPPLPPQLAPSSMPPHPHAGSQQLMNSHPMDHQHRQEGLGQFPPPQHGYNMGCSVAPGGGGAAGQAQGYYGTFWLRGGN